MNRDARQAAAGRGAHPGDPPAEPPAAGGAQVSSDARDWPAIVVMDCHEAHVGMDGETTAHDRATTNTSDTLDLPRMTQVARATTGPTSLDPSRPATLVRS